MIILIKIILAHLIVDFFLQPKKWVDKKVKLKAKSWTLYAHVFIHGALVLILLGSLKYWLLALIILTGHLLIDLSKIYFQKKKNQIKWFLGDQLMHLVFIVLVWALWFDQMGLLRGFFLSPEFLIIFTSVLFLTAPMAIILSVVLKPWANSIPKQENQSLENAGKYIGILERLFVLGMILIGRWEVVGFLLAAKSVFRFGDLRESKDRKLTEYILIGTLISFGSAILTGLLAGFLL